MLVHSVHLLTLFFSTHLFFSFTETDEGVSLVLDEEGVNNLLLQDPLAKDVVQVCDILWRPVQLAEGSLGFSMFVARVCVCVRQRVRIPCTRVLVCFVCELEIIFVGFPLFVVFSLLFF